MRRRVTLMTMKGNDMTKTSQFVKARRGDLIVVHTHHSEMGGYDFFRVGVVTNITRDGQVRKVSMDGGAPLPLDHVGVDIRGTWLMPQDKWDVTAALETAASNPWPHAPEHKGKPYDTLDETREALRPHRK